MKRALEKNRVDVACILKPNDVTYLGGYAPVCAGMLVFQDLDAVFCTLWLDAPEARRLVWVADIVGYVFPRERLIDKMAEIVKKRKPHPRRIGVEKDFMLLRDYEMLTREFPEAEFIHITPAIDRLRAIKSKEEIEMIRKSASISDQGMDAALRAVRAGATELDIAAEAEYVMKKLGSEKTAFSSFVASGDRTLLAHPIASRRQIQPGEPVVIDLGATWEGYASDICRTTFAGEPTAEQLELLRTIVKAQQEAAAIIQDGVECHEVFERVNDVFQEKRLGKYLPHDIGYGVGLRQSEFYPVIEKGSTTVLQENMVVAFLQTTSYLRSVGGLRVEDTFRIMKSGCEKLTTQPQPFLD
jgi:Xaa-Pro dipeptidase